MVTQRLELRPFSLADAAAVQALAGDPRVADTTSAIPHPYEDGMAESWISSHRAFFEAGKGVICAVTLRGSGQLVGAIDLILDDDRKKGAVGYWIGLPFWGNGYCTEALKALVDFGFRHYVELHRIYAIHMTRNPSSGRVLEKAGFQHEGRLREHLRARGRMETVEMYGILRDDWQARSEFHSA